MKKPKRAPYGSWRSPIITELITSKSIALGQIAVDGKDIYWLEGRPLEGGRNALVRLSPGLRPAECLPPEFNVRTRVHEYGGAAYAIFDQVIYFVNFKDQHLYRQKPGGFIELITPDENCRYTDLILDQIHDRLICVREDHRRNGEAINTITAISLKGGGDGSVLVEGSDFYSNPRLSPDGSELAWLCWSHPNMPWDGCELWKAEVLPDGSLGKREFIAGGKSESIFQPEWSPDGTLYFISDRSNWWNLYRIGVDGIEAVHPMEAEFGEAQWAFGFSRYVFITRRNILCTYSQDGTWKLAKLDADEKTLTLVDLPYTEYKNIHVGDGFTVFEAGSGTEPLSIIKMDNQTGQTVVLQRAFELALAEGYFSVPEPIEFPTENGLISHGFFYRPTNKDYSALVGEYPPLVVISHGGPTGTTSICFSYNTQYWTSRGFAVLDVNYGGSTGYGREYRMRLNGKWGIVDVDDCCNGARWLAKQGLVDVHRMVIRGGSAGGYTTLAALVFKNVFSAGASHYGISDIETLAKDTHKFESRYLDNLIGLYPEKRDLYVERSPIHHLETLTTPLILFQGDEDKVVPPAQSQAMYEAVRAKGIPVAYLLFSGEQHGFRKAENIRRSIEAELYFYSRIFKFDPGDPLEPVQIENLE